MMPLTARLIEDAFGLTKKESSALKDDTRLEDLYWKYKSKGQGDNLEFETLTSEVQRVIGRKLTEQECQIETVGGLNALLGQLVPFTRT